LRNKLGKGRAACSLRQTPLLVTLTDATAPPVGRTKRQSTPFTAPPRAAATTSPRTVERRGKRNGCVRVRSLPFGAGTAPFGRRFRWFFALPEGDRLRDVARFVLSPPGFRLVIGTPGVSYLAGDLTHG